MSFTDMTDCDISITTFIFADLSFAKVEIGEKEESNVVLKTFLERC